MSGSLKDGQTLAKEVVPGSHSVQEAALADWDLREIRCDDPTGDSTGDLATRTATFRVNAGETVRCVFTNTKRGVLLLEKQTDPDGDPGSFPFNGETRWRGHRWADPEQKGGTGHLYGTGNGALRLGPDGNPLRRPHGG